MAYTEQLDTFVSRLKESTDLKDAQAVLLELLDMIETFNGAAEYEYFLSNLVPMFMAKLDEVPISFVSLSPEHKVRNTILEIIHRLIMNETFQPYADQILEKLTTIVVEENEENGVVCMKIITSLHKAFKAVLADKVEAFIAVINTIYDNMPEVVATRFENEQELEDPSPFGDEGKELANAMYSFKTLAECPITMVSLYSSYKSLVQTSLPEFLPKTINILTLQVEQQKQFHEQAEVVTSVSPEITNRALYSDFILGQVKAASFLAYVFIRGYANQFLSADHANSVPEVILRLLQDCPAELSVARKELLHATRHILSTPFRSHFIPKIELLFNEQVLVGSGLTSHETLRPLAYSTVADFIHNVRNELTPKQIWSTVKIYCDLLKDDSLALTVQIMSAKLLLNLVERIMKLPNKLEGRQLFMIIIDSYAKRFESLNRKHHHILARHRQFEKKKALKEIESKRAVDRYTSKAPLPEPEDVDMESPPELDIFSLEEELPISMTVPASTDLLKDARYLFRTLMTFLKSVIFGLKNCNPPVPPQPTSDPKQTVNYDKWNDSARLTSYEEIVIFRGLFRGGINCLKFFSVSKPKPTPTKFDFSSGGPNLPITSSKEEKDLMEIFATIFIHVDPASFNEIVSSELPFMFESMLDNAALLHLPQFFLASEVTSANFSGILVSFLRLKLELLGKVDLVESNILIRLFKLCFMSVNLFPTANESVMLPHLNHLILQSLKLATTADEPIVYSYLVRILFRSISGGRFESLYKEIMPILPVLLDSLNKLIANSRRPHERDIYVELCLTVPVRLSVLVPHLNYLTRPLVYALNGLQELVSQGLRTFELCVDNLTAEYFDPMIEPVIDEIMAALWKHLEPIPYHHQHSHTAIRILGKLGGRNHKHFKPCELETSNYPDIVADFDIHGLGTELVNISVAVEAAIAMLEDPRLKTHYRINAYNYLSNILKLFIDSRPVPPQFTGFVQNCVNQLQNEVEIVPLEPSALAEVDKLAGQQKLFERLLQVVFYAVLVPDISAEAGALIDGLTTHFCFVYLGTSVIDKIKKERPFSVADQEGRACISDTAFLNALNYALSSEVRDKGVEVIKRIHQITSTMFGDAVLDLPVFRAMFYKFTHACYSEYYSAKLGGILGLSTMFEIIPALWFVKRQFEMVRAIFFVLRDTPDTAPAEVCERARTLVLQVLKQCNSEATTEKPFQTLIGALVYDLASANPQVRSTSQQAFAVLSEATGMSVATIIGPCKQLLLTPIFGKPLRALPFPMQIGNIDAITFCLDLDDTFLTFNDELNRLLLEALALVDAEDESLANVHRLYEYRTSRQLIELRVVCIKFLSLALTKSDFSIGSLAEARIRILGVFFKALCNKLTEIINAAHLGLKASLKENAKLPKELLQNGLRPMLMNLSDHKKLTVSGLEALARLLELLISYFRVEIGRKLLDHLMAWAQINTLRQIAGLDLENNHTVQIVMAILNIFHLLPAKAYTFMEEIINTLQYLEGHLDRHQGSPFRTPVAKYLDRFADNCLEYYMLNYKNRKLGNMLASFVAMDLCPNVRRVALEKLPAILDDVEAEEEAKVTKFANVVELVLAIPSADWSEELVLRLVKVMPQIPLAPLVSSTHFQYDQAATKLEQIVAQYMRENNDPNMFFEVYQFSGPVADFVFDTVATHPYEFLEQGLDFVAGDHDLLAKVVVMKQVVNAILIYDATTTGFTKTEWLEKVATIWRQPDTTTDSLVADSYRFQLLEMTAILLKYAPEQVSEYKKDIIKFAWSYIKLRDNIAKQVAYVTTAYFIRLYETPLQLATQVFVALLRTHQTDSRHLVRQALDIVAPVMEDRMDESPLKWPRRVISEDGFNVTQVLNVYQFVVHHPDLFFSAREHFVSNIITAMGKLTILANPAVENQVLAIDLAELILKWEKRSKGSPTTYKIPFGQREACVTFLVRYVCISPQRASESELGQKALGILYELVSPDFWLDVAVKLAFFEKFLLSNDLNSANLLGYCLNALEVMGVVLEWKLPEWIVNNLPYLHKLLEKCIKSDNHDIQEGLQRVLRLILGAIQEETDETKEFVGLLTTTVAEDLGDMPSVAAGVTLLWTLANYRPATLDLLVPLIMRTFSKLCKDHITITHQQKDANFEYEAKMTTRLLEKILQLSLMCISTLGDQRRIFLSLLAQLIERLLDKETLEKIINIVKGWVFSNTDLFPTTKEKAAILAKMMVFEIRGEPTLSKEFYQIIIDIFEDDAFSCTDLTVRMEQPFLVGTRLADVLIRRKLMSILNNSLEKDVSKRLYYVIREQNWEFLADYNWLNQGLQLIYGLFDHDKQLVYDTRLPPVSDAGEDVGGPVADLIAEHNRFLSLLTVTAGHVLEPMVDMFYQNSNIVHKAWAAVFPVAFKSIPRSENLDFTRFLVILLSKDYHTRQVDSRPNVIQSLLEGILRCPDLQLPPFAVECLASNFDAWTQGIHILERMEEQTVNGNPEVHEITQDALAKLYAALKEDDTFYGLWKRRAKYLETLAALSHEQIGLWDKAQQLYEAAQIKARSGVLPYGESEYTLWEDHWILCAEKLQHWDILTELAKHEGFSDLLLECGWRVADWNTDRDTLQQTVKSVMDVPTPRRQMFETFLCLQSYRGEKDILDELSKLCDAGIQLALRKWHGLPRKFANAHIPLLHTFQQYVEFMEASQVYASLVLTNAQNLDIKSQELKRVLQVWRERLPNTWDDINIWNDLVTWRQHAFQVINKVYMPFIPVLQQTSSGGNANSYAYRGFHEIAWVINRFAHVARKHGMADVCNNQLSKIYQLPNIEIQEAFLKLKEQVKCHYQNPGELNTGLDVISNTNLVYFATQQKAEFFTLKGMFLNKMNQKDEANKAFATSVQIDLNLPKAWAEWGMFNDRRFKENSNDMVYANNAISCYLQAAGLYKNGKTRKLLARILWLISLDDASGTLSQAFDTFRGEVPAWYWLTFIPQLLTSLSHKEARLVKQILIRIAKSYPQALHFQLRTTKEDFAAKLRQVEKEDESTKQALEHVEEIMGILKTAYPLLTLSLESLVDQINQRFKCTADEDAYRLGVALLNDGVQYLNRLGNPREDAKLPPVTEANITRFAETVLPKQIRAEFEKDLVVGKPNLETYIIKLRKWRDRLEDKLDRRPSEINLENLCPHLSEFHHQKFEEIEVPGQYLLNRDNNTHFVKIERFLPTMDLARGTNACYKRLKIRGHDGSLHAFAVQFPAARHCRREESIFQLFRIFGDSLSRKVETRRRNIDFTVPIAVPLSPHIRIISDDVQDITMQKVYEDFCRRQGRSRDEPFVYTIDKLRAAYDPRLPKPDLMSIRVEILSAIQTMLVPLTVLKNYFMDLYPLFEDFWLFRKQFLSQYALFIFSTYMMCVNTRQPQKIHINRGSGNVWTSDMLPCKIASKNALLDGQRSAPLFYNAEMVPFRLTPNIQKLIGETGMEGILSIYLLVIARALTEPESDLEQYLTLFVRDEVVSWCSQQDPPRSLPQDSQLREIVRMNVDLVIKRVLTMGHPSSNQSVTTQNILDLISQAVNPRNLAAADTLWMAYF